MIYIVIPVFNRWPYTKACLESLSKQSYISFKIIVVDHGSTDGTADHIANEFPDVIVIKGNELMWWTAATNFGIRHAINLGATYILTLNNDTIAEIDYIYHLNESIKDNNQKRLIGSTAIDAYTKKVIYRGEKMNWYTESSKFMSASVHLRPENGLVEISHFPGRGLLIPVVVFNKIGFFDELGFPHYMVDYDFTLRAVKFGFDIFCSWDAKIRIYPEASGANQLKVNKTMSGYREHLFGTRGGGNLPLFYRYAFRHCPLFALPSYVFLGTGRRLVGYWLKNK